MPVTRREFIASSAALAGALRSWAFRTAPSSAAIWAIWIGSTRPVRATVVARMNESLNHRGPLALRHHHIEATQTRHSEPFSCGGA